MTETKRCPCGHVAVRACVHCGRLLCWAHYIFGPLSKKQENRVERLELGAVCLPACTAPIWARIQEVPEWRPSPP